MGEKERTVTDAKRDTVKRCRQARTPNRRKSPGEKDLILGGWHN